MKAGTAGIVIIMFFGMFKLATVINFTMVDPLKAFVAYHSFRVITNSDKAYRAYVNRPWVRFDAGH